MVSNVILNACIYRNRISNSVILSLDYMDDYVFVKLPDDALLDNKITSISEISYTLPDETNEPEFECMCNRPWLKIKFNTLNTDIGMHIYRISLFNNYTEDSGSLYFSYQIQNSNPDKPYIYMNRENS